MACRWRRSWFVFVHCQILEARFMSFRHLLLDMRPSALIAVSFWCSSCPPRLCGLSAVGAWSSRASVDFGLGLRVMATTWVFRHGWWFWWCSEAFSVWGLMGLFLAATCAAHAPSQAAAALADSFSVEFFLCCFVVLCFLWQFALCAYKLSLWQSLRMCDRLPVQVKVYVNVEASFCWLGFF